MKRPSLVVLGSLSAGLFLLLIGILAYKGGIPLLFPSGFIGIAERDLMLRTVFLMLIVVIPVVLLAIFIAWHYREGNRTATYRPDWEHSRMEELIWWSIPLEIVLVLGALTWTATHELDPARAISSSEPPLVIQVVALPWKWLFIYPEEGIASVNEVTFPIHRPVKFQITADAPMNSFWIPALGGQIYAMTGMSTVLHLIASQSGTYDGMSANYSGEGFAQMRFAARAVEPADFETWVATVRNSPDVLTQPSYQMLATPGDPGPVRYYGAIGITYTDIMHASMSDRSPARLMPSHGH